MGYPVGSTGQVYNPAGTEIGMGSAAMDYIPTLYAGKLLIKFYETSVLGEIANTDYEGMIRDQGDSVIIRTLPTISVTAHHKGMTLSDQVPESTSVTLNIDKGFYWSFRTDDPDMVQTDINSLVNEWTSEASYELRNKVEIEVLQNITTDMAAKNQGATAGVTSGTVHLGTTAAPRHFGLGPTDFIMDGGLVLDEQNVPDTGRWFLLPPVLINVLKKDNTLQDASKMGDATSVIRNGMVGMIDRFTIYKTQNLLTNGAGATMAWYCLFGTKHALTFASQLVKTKSLDNPTGFGMLHRGLQVFGYKVVKPEAMGVLVATAESGTQD
jgi:hypothetical protein